MTWIFLVSHFAWSKSGRIPRLPPARLALPGVSLLAMIPLVMGSLVLAAWNACSIVGYWIPSNWIGLGQKLLRNACWPWNVLIILCLRGWWLLVCVLLHWSPWG